MSAEYTQPSNGDLEEDEEGVKSEEIQEKMGLPRGHPFGLLDNLFAKLGKSQVPVHGRVWSEGCGATPTTKILD